MNDVTMAKRFLAMNVDFSITQRGGFFGMFSYKNMGTIYNVEIIFGDEVENIVVYETVRKGFGEVLVVEFDSYYYHANRQGVSGSMTVRRYVIQKSTGSKIVEDATVKKVFSRNTWRDVNESA